jgi:hypothetical protein
MSPGTQASTSQKQLSSMDIIKRRRNCSRLLFGVPDRDELDEWLNRNADRHATEAKSKWNFDFEKGVPLNTSGQSSSSSTFEYERVEGVEVSRHVPKFQLYPYLQVPKFYRTRPARQKLLRLRTNQFETNSNSSAEPPKEQLKRAESTPVIGTTKTVSRTLKKVVSQAVSQLVQCDKFLNKIIPNKILIQ